MPFRQLPNTDATRLVALDALLRKTATVPEDKRPYPANLHEDAATLMARFTLELQQTAAALTAQTAATSRANLAFDALQIAVSHYLQVLNLAIVRGIIPRTARAHYGLDLDSTALPSLDTQAEVALWADRVVTGEATRLAADPAAVPMAMPSAAEVGTAASQYATAAAARTAAKDAYDTKQEDVAALRPTADTLIREIWDRIEFAHRTDPAPSRRRKCREWGLTYLPRRGEKAGPEESGDGPAAPTPPQS